MPQGKLRNLSGLFTPKSVAVVGASQSPEKVGAIVLKNVIDSKFPGKIYPVNPHADKIGDLICYKDIQSLPETPDLAILAIPAPLIIETLDQLAAKSIKNAVVFAAGFKEMGEEGKQLEKTLASAAEKYDINLLGPNCLGFVNNNCPINATFGEAVQGTGNLRFVSQSGAIAASLFDWCNSTGLGFGEFITLGNKAVLNENDVLQYFMNLDKNNVSSLKTDTAISDWNAISDCHPTGLYLESISNGGDFLRITSQISKKDPIFILKPGKTNAAAKAMQSHTGAIAGEDAVLGAVLNQAGVIRCETLEDFFDLSRAFSWENLPEGPKVAIISNAGGPAVISADAVVENGLELTEFDPATKSNLMSVLPRTASILNPVDVLGDALADRFSQAAEIIFKTDQVHALIVILTPQIMTQIEKTADFIGNLSKKYKKPIFCSFIGGSTVAEGEKILNSYKIPSFRFPERAIFAIGTMWKFRKRQLEQLKPVDLGNVLQVKIQPDLSKIETIIDAAIKKNHKTLDNIESDQLLSAIQIPTPPTRDVDDVDQAVAWAENYGWPVVLKLSSPGILHKRHIGGVVCDIRNQDQLDDAWNTLERKKEALDEASCEHVKIQIQKDIEGGVEVIVGVKRDPTFGPVMLFGAGGSLAELIGDRNLHLLPIDAAQARALVEKSKIYSLLKGNDGEPPYALEQLYSLMVRLGKLAELLPNVTDIEINPVIVTLNNVWAVDGKVILEEGKPRPVCLPHYQTAKTAEVTLCASKFRFFEFESEEPINFLPGQYISVRVSGDRVNCYSIASRSGSNKFNLFVNSAPGGPGSKFFESLKVGDKITYMGPFGVFYLKLDDNAKQLLFLCTGSAIAPLRSMIESALIEQKSKLPMSLYIGLNSSDDVFWSDYLAALAQQYPNFNYRIVVNKADDTWKGDVGFITPFVEKDFPDAGKCSAYLSGNKSMIEDCSAMLLKHGCPKERIYTEKV